MSTNNDSTQHVQIAVADPTPLGLFGLAVVTMVASAQKLCCPVFPLHSPLKAGNQKTPNWSFLHLPSSKHMGN